MKRRKRENLFKDILLFIWNIIKSRIFILSVIIMFMFSIIVVRLFSLQVVHSEDYINNYIQKTEKEILINSTRGNIYDRNGVLLAYNELTYSVQISDTLDSSKYKNVQMNDIIYKTISIIEKYGDELIYDFPIVMAGNVPTYSETLSERSRLRFLKNIYGTEILDTKDEHRSDTTAEQAYDYLMEKYEVSPENYDESQIIKILMIRYNLSLNFYQKYKTTTIAKNVSQETVAAIYEEEANIPGVIISEDTIRRYNESLYFAHIIGYTAKISEDELVEFNQAGGNYTSSDIVGKTGVEASFETVLSGTKGEQRVLVDNLGKVLSVVDSVDATAGSDVYLTLDVNLQKGIYHQIEQKLAGVLISYIVNGNLTEKQKEELYIPVKDVYFQIFNNNIVDIDKFSLDGASQNEKTIYEKYKQQYNDILARIQSDLYDDNAAALNRLTDEWNEYYTHIYQKLTSASYNLNIIDVADKSDSVYVSWLKDEINLRSFLQYAITQNWIDLSKIDIEDKYADSELIYTTLVDYIVNMLSEDSDFDKIIYKHMIDRNIIRANEVCMTLYDQNVISMNETAYERLRKNNGYAYEFIIEQIREIKITPAQIALKPCSGSVVLTDPDTGNVLALVSYPSYDNNVFSGSIDYEYWTKLSADASTPMYNRATKTRTAPGSTFKPLVAVAALTEGVVGSNTIIQTRGIFENDNITTTPKCWIYPGRHGSINIVKAIEVSCNCFFYEVGFRLGSYGNTGFSHNYGLSRLKKYAEMFGLTEKSGVEIDEYVPLFSDSDIIVSSIGQGSHSYTNTQLSRYVSTIANGGYNYRLTLIQKVVSNDGTVTNNERRTVEKADISDSVLKTVQTGMRQVISVNMQSLFRNVEFSVAGKTGTAQEGKNDPPHGVFIGYAPYENPEVAISVVIPNGHNSDYPTELARNVLRYYFGYIGIDTILQGVAEMPNTVVQRLD